MKLHFAGAEAWPYIVNRPGVESVLLSYYAMTMGRKSPAKLSKPIKDFHDTGKSVFLDSGGFSAFTKGVEIDIAQYADFIKANGDHIDVAANLDVVGDFRASMQNQRKLESMGVNPLPVFHYGGDLGDLRSLISEYNYIALGGLVPYARQRQKLMRWLDKCFDIIRLDCKIHGFGMTGLDVLKRYPWFSCDSTSWISGSKQGMIYDFLPARGDIKTTHVEDKSGICHNKITLLDASDKRWRERLIRGLEEWSKVQKYITKLWAKRGITWTD